MLEQRAAPLTPPPPPTPPSSLPPTPPDSTGAGRHYGVCVGGVSLAGDWGREKRNRCGPEVSGADRYGLRGAVVRGALYGVHKCLPKIALPTRVRLIGVMLLLPADQAIPACGCDCLLQEQAEASEGLCSVSS